MLYAAVCLTTASSCTGRKAADAVVERRPVKVGTLTVGIDGGVSGSRYVGEIVPDKDVVVTASYPGTLESIAVRKGDRVQKGALLAEISSQSVRSSLEIAQATLRQAEDGYERLQMVAGSGSVSQVQMIDIETKLAKAKASAKAAEQAVADCRVKSPFAGVVSEVMVDSGVEVGVAQPLVRIVDVSRVSIRISVHENEINRIAPGSIASVDIPALSISGVPAMVRGKSLVPSALSHSYDCTLEFVSLPSGVMPGMAVKAVFDVDGDSAITVPASSVQMDKQGKYVWISDQGRVRKARISVGGYSGRNVVVTDGLCPGDKVITAGYQKVSTGMEVTE